MFVLASIIICSILIVLFIWGAWGISSEQKDGKAQQAGIYKTIVMLIITVAVGCFYYKTYQVTTIRNFISIKGIKSTVDSNFTPVDTLEYVLIKGSFSNSGKEYNEINRLARNQYYDDNMLYNLSIMKYGGVLFRFKFNIDTVYSISKIANFSEFGFCSAEDSSYYKGADHIYHYDYISSRINSVIPLKYKYRETDTGFYDYSQGDYVYKRLISCSVADSSIRKAPSEEIINIMGNHSMRTMGEFGTSYLNKFYKDFISNDSTYKDSVRLEMSISGDDMNTMNLLTAADLTQCNYDIIYDFNCPIKRLLLTFDIPVSMPQLPYGLKPIDSYSYVIEDPEELSKLKKGSLLLHVQFPTLTNMQLIRSLILTSVLTAFFSLFCINAFYCVRKHIHLSNRKKWRNLYRIIVIIIIALITYIVFAMMFDRPVYIEVDPNESMKYE